MSCGCLFRHAALNETTIECCFVCHQRPWRYTKDFSISNDDKKKVRESFLYPLSRAKDKYIEKLPKIFLPVSFRVFGLKDKHSFDIQIPSALKNAAVKAMQKVFDQCFKINTVCEKGCYLGLSLRLRKKYKKKIIPFIEAIVKEYLCTE